MANNNKTDQTPVNKTNPANKSGDTDKKKRGPCKNSLPT